jgi:hypothetical protein
MGTGIKGRVTADGIPLPDREIQKTDLPAKASDRQMSGVPAIIFRRPRASGSLTIGVLFTAVWDMAKVTRDYKGVRIVEIDGYFSVDLGVNHGWEFFQSLREAEAFIDQRLLELKSDEQSESEEG